MSGVAGFLAGAIGLSLLSVATSSAAAGSRVGGLVGAGVSVVRYIVDPTVPAIPDRHAATAAPASPPASSPSSAASSTTTVVPPAPIGGGRYQQP